MNMDDTIAAIATASGTGAISIVRVSGPDSLSLADRLFRCSSPPPSSRAGGTFVYGKVEGPDGGIDEGILLIYRAPKSYTREDVVEIQCHGGRESARRILRLVLEAGARPAEPGEFTKRAFLNGRLDLVQAEAVMDLISAQSTRAAQAAMEQLNGALSHSVSAIYNDLITSSADLEATLDFPDEEFPADILQAIITRVIYVGGEVSRLLETWEEGHRLREGALVVISGLPNAGKSTLLNRLLGKDRAIVSPHPGTTRDVIEETFILNGIPIRLVDTAGLRTTACAIEQEGIARARSYIGQADLRLHIVDASLPFSSADRESLADSQANSVIVVLNKQDLGTRVDPSGFTGYSVVSLSLVEDTDLAPLLSAMGAKLDRHPHDPPHATLSERHRQLLLQAGEALTEAHSLLARSDGLVLAASRLREAAEQVGQITGQVYYEDLLTRIFTRFCIGK